MKQIVIYVLLVAMFFSCKNNTDKESHSLKKETTKEAKVRPSDFMLMQRSYPNGINTSSINEALAWRNQQKAEGLTQNQVWELVGPINVGGRITDVEIPVNDANTYYVGAASGGIFKTTDGGSTWNAIFDEQDYLSIGDIEISKKNPNLVWVGTGEVNSGGGSMTYDGNGVFKSTDAGLTWENKGLPKIGGVGKVLIDPSDDNTIFIGAMGAIFRQDEHRGIYRSKDGGNTWEKVLFISDKTGIVDMAIHPENGNIIYAAAWERVRTPTNRKYGGETSGIYRSKDGGDTWEELTSGLPSRASDKGRISIAISESNPNVLYTRYATAEGRIQGVYRSSNGGDTWTERNSSQLSNIGFHWWFRGIYVDPTNENTIYNVDYKVQKSTDGGQNWSNTFSNVHVDQHALAFNKKKPGQVLLGNDGGLYYSSNGGSSPKKDKNLPINQFYRIYVDAQNEKAVYGGTQDNSIMRTKTGSLDDWTIITGGDGFQPLVDPNNSQIIYGLSQYGNFSKSTNGGNGFMPAMTGISNGDRKNWDTPITFNPKNSKTLYYGSNKLYRSTNSAGNWSAISDDLTKGKQPGNQTYATIFSIDPSPIDSKIIYVGTDDGNVWVTKDSGSNWTKISDNLPNRWVTKVLADPLDVNSVYVTYSGYNYGEQNGHVFKSTDFGKNWTDIGTSLPDIPVNDIVKDKKGHLYLGTDIGVLGSPNDGKNWVVVGENLPSVRVPDLHIHERSQHLYAGTFGRSIYKIDISGDIMNTPKFALKSEIKMFPNPASEFVTIIFKSNLNTSITIFDSLGRQVINDIKSNKSVVQIPLSNVSAGNYFLKISNSKGESITKKLIIKK